MAANTFRHWFLLDRPIMKRLCMLCDQHFRYDKVKERGPHKVRICNYCLDVIYFSITDDMNRYGT